MNKIKQKTYFNILILSFIVMAIFYVGKFYLIETVKNLSLEVVDKKQKIERLNKQSDQIDSIRIGYGYMQKEMNRVSDLVVDYSKIVDYIVEIENIAKKNEVDLEINVLNKEGEYSKDNLSSVSYNIKTVGSFNNLMHFLVDLENLKYLNKMEKIRMYHKSKSKNNFTDLNKVNSDEIVLDIDVEVYVKNRDLK